MPDTKALVKQLYPKVEASISNNLKGYKNCLSRFMETRAESLYAPAPYDRIYFTAQDEDDFYSSIKLNKAEATSALSQTYYNEIKAFNPACAKDEFTVSQLMVVRYFYLKKMDKELELSMIYLAFSGKFYPSIHYGSFPKVQPSEYKHVMDYAINNMLTNKYDIKAQGSVIGAVKEICKTWIKSYGDRLKDDSDESKVYILQQLHSRIKSFMINIAKAYYEAYEDKDSYMSYDSDNLDEDSYRLADNDSLKAERAVENAMNKINSSGVDYKLCKMSSDSNVKVDEVKSIIEGIISDNKNLPEIKEFLRLLVITYFEQSKTKDVRDVEFISFSIAAKPNSKDPNILREKEIVESWLTENSPSYRKRKSRLATKNSYYKSIFTYFTLVINTANK